MSEPQEMHDAEKTGAETPTPLYNLGTAQAVLDACTWDVAHEEARMQTIDSKLGQLAAFSGISISISAGVGGSVIASGQLSLGFLIALGACIVLASSLLLGGVISAFYALAPKLYDAIDEAAVEARTTPNALRGDTSEAVANIAAGRRNMFMTARGINDDKATATTRTFRLVGAGFAVLVAAVVVIAVGSVV